MTERTLGEQLAALLNQLADTIRNSDVTTIDEVIDMLANAGRKPVNQGAMSAEIDHCTTAGHAWVGGMRVVNDEDLDAIAAVREVTCSRCGLWYVPAA